MIEDTVYLDRAQCRGFEIEYFNKSSFSIRADRLLASKDSGYDDHHWKILGPLRSGIVRLKRNKSDPPGWYQIF